MYKIWYKLRRIMIMAEIRWINPRTMDVSETCITPLKNSGKKNGMPVSASRENETIMKRC